MTDHTRTMRDVSHTHPYTDRGAINRPFERGPVIAADGGRRDAERRPRQATPSDGGKRGAHGEEKRTMKDVDHTPPSGEGANPVFERGGEHDEEDVAEE